MSDPSTSKRRPWIVVAGPTGSGKSELALRLGGALGAEIVNYDSIQVYRGFDIGSAKPSVADRQLVPHHLIDEVDADEDYDAFRFAREARVACDGIVTRGHQPILAGGTFFYLRALLRGLPPMPARDEAIRARLRRVASSPRGPARLHRWLARVDPQTGTRVAEGDRHRVERALEVWILSGQPISRSQAPTADSEVAADTIRIALTLPRERLVEILERRVDAMYAAGLIEETRDLLQRFPAEARPFAAIGYREAAQVLGGALAEPAAVAETKRRTRGYAKRQMTWLRSERNMHWVDAGSPEAAFQAALRVIEGQD